MKDTIIKAQNPSIKLNRGMNGKYGWEIRVLKEEGMSWHGVIKVAEKVDLELQKKFGEQV